MFQYFHKDVKLLQILFILLLLISFSFIPVSIGKDDFEYEQYGVKYASPCEGEKYITLIKQFT
jgi:hypothetical protein